MEEGRGDLKVVSRWLRLSQRRNDPPCLNSTLKLGLEIRAGSVTIAWLGLLISLESIGWERVDLCFDLLGMVLIF